MKKITLIIGIMVTLMFPSLAFASSTASESYTCQGVSVISQNTSGNCDSFKTSSRSLDGIVSLILNILSGIVGIVAVVMIIISGLKYVTSGGSSEKTTSAKETILYAVIGLIIVALAQIIVKFILHKASAL